MVNTTQRCCYFRYFYRLQLHLCLITYFHSILVDFVASTHCALVMWLRISHHSGLSWCIVYIMEVWSSFHHPICLITVLPTLTEISKMLLIFTGTMMLTTTLL